MYQIREISSEETIEVRHSVLRIGKPRESSVFVNDDDASTIHLGLFLDDQLIGVVSLFDASTLLMVGKQYQLRGMAILKEFQRKGYGRVLLQEIESYCQRVCCDLLWFNARESALAFYQALDYKIISPSFMIENIGIHYVMAKSLSKKNCNLIN